MNVLVLGPLELRRDGELLVVRRGRPRRLLLSLVLRRGGAVPQTTLIDQLWGEEPPANAENALHILVSYLRKPVRAAGLAVERSSAGYRLVAGPDAVDMTVFERLVARARSAGTDAAARLDAAGRALALWRGPALSEAADDPFARGDVVRLEELRLQALETRTGALLELGRHDEALPDLAQLVREHPFREALHGQLAVALYRAGRQADALRALERARATLVDELGLDPSADLQRLEQQVLRQDPSLAPPAPAPRARLSGPTPDRTGTAPTAPGVRPPGSLTALVGREEQLTALTDAVDRHRVVTLTGPGGVGKSRLAAEWARQQQRQALWADLSAADGAAAVEEAVLAAVGTARSAEHAAADVARALSDRPAVLVLDTCEHVAEAVRELVVALVDLSPDLRVVATSRSPLGVAGELTWPVPPLTLPGPGDRLEAVTGSPAVQLFTERARLVRPDFAVSQANAADVAAVCRLLDGLPLAIELAAGHVTALSLAKIVDLLGDRMRLLGHARHRPDRHAGLRSAIGWSYELLSSDEARFLDRLSVFAAPFVVEAAAEVAGAGLSADGLSLLLGLVRQSLVSVAGDDHFRLLDTVRAYAAARLRERPDEVRAALDRHARWFAAFAEEADRSIRGADQAGWLAELRTAGPDLRTALQHCLGTGQGSPASSAPLGARTVCSLSWFWSHEGAFSDARRWVERARAAGPYDRPTEARLHLAAGMHAESVGDLALSEDECRSAATVFASLGDERGEGRSLLHVGTALWASGRLAEAAAVHDRAVGLLRGARQDSDAGLGLVLRARTAVEQGDTALAHELLADAGYVLRRVGDQHLVALCLEQRARTALHDAHPRQAGSLARQALAVFEHVGYPEGAVAALQTVGSAHLADGDGAEAVRAFAEAVTRADDLGHAPALAEGMDLLAQAVAGLAELRGAARLLGHADAVRARSGLALRPEQARRRQGLIAVLDEHLAGRWQVEHRTGAAMSPAELVAAVPPRRSG